MSVNLSAGLIKECNAVCEAADVQRILQCGLSCQSNGRLEEARGCYQHVLTLSPTHFDALHMLGVVAIQTHRLTEAVTLIELALAQKNHVAAAHRNYALALRESGRKQEAADAYSRSIALEPTHAASYVHLAELLVDLGRPMQALACCDGALKMHEREPVLHLARAVSLRGCEHVEEALASCETAITLRPDYPEAWDKRGGALYELGRSVEALQSQARAVELRPDFAVARHHASFVHLQMGQFDPGWELHENREQARRDFGRPRWQLRHADKKASVLFHSEQGLGDTIQFARYARLAAESGARVTLMVQPPLLGIMRTLGTEITVIVDTPGPPITDYQCPLMSLPCAFRTDLGSIPASIPYLMAEPERVIAWRKRLGSTGFKIGICWHGSGVPAAVGKAFPIALLAPIAQLSGVRLISLQKGLGIEQLEKSPPRMRVEDLGEFDSGQTAFLDTAAVMEGLDLVITCDTSIAHLAGALGRPTWIALKHVADWRWLTDRADSPWYPGVRLFRQPRAGDWSGVFASMLSQLQERNFLSDEPQRRTR